MEIQANKLPFNKLEFVDDDQAIRFDVGGSAGSAI